MRIQLYSPRSVRIRLLEFALHAEDAPGWSAGWDRWAAGRQPYAVHFRRSSNRLAARTEELCRRVAVWSRQAVQVLEHQLPPRQEPSQLVRPDARLSHLPARAVRSPLIGKTQRQRCGRRFAGTMVSHYRSIFWATRRCRRALACLMSFTQQRRESLLLIPRGQVNATYEYFLCC